MGIVDLDVNAASHTGSACFDWAGGRTGPGFAIQGNILAGPEVVDAMHEAWVTSTGESSLAQRLLEVLAAGDEAGGDSRGRQSAALLVVRDGAGYGGGDDVDVDLRVDDHPDPIHEMRRLLALQDLYLTASTDEEKVPLDDDLRAELDERARELGHRDLVAWIGTENYEMRLGPGWIDRTVLAILREQSGDDEGTDA